MKEPITLIGPGKVGCAVTARLHAAGYPVSGVISRSHGRALEACRFIGCPQSLAGTDLALAGGRQIILLAVPDDVISKTAGILHAKGSISEETTLVHFSGLHPASILAGPDGTRSALLSLHPLLPFADRLLAMQQLAHCPCALEGNRCGLKMGRILVRDLGARGFELAASDKSAYHTAASIASNFLVTLVAEAQSLLETCQIDHDKALELLGPLIRASVDNVLRAGPNHALTGPIVRGDVKTVARHLHTLAERKAETVNLYCHLGESTLRLAQHSGRLDKYRAAALYQVLASKGKE